MSIETLTTLEEDQAAAEAERAMRETRLRKRVRMSSRTRLILIITGLLMAGVLRTGFVFLIIALLPSIVAYFTDVTSERYNFKSIFFCNLAGVLPHLTRMIGSGTSNAVMQQIMGSAQNWLVIYSAALVGWLLVEICPVASQIFMQWLHQSQISRLRRLQHKIESEWGPEIRKVSDDVRA